jgi:hypothetical protein
MPTDDFFYVHVLLVICLQQLGRMEVTSSGSSEIGLIVSFLASLMQIGRKIKCPYWFHVNSLCYMFSLVKH